MRSSKKYVDETLKKYQLTANKALGQNFLVNQKITDKIIENANVNNNSIIIEIGPGLGALTEKCIEIAKQVIAIEIDNNMCNILKDEFKDISNLEIIHEDFLKLDFDNLLNALDKNSPITLISNLPYYITSQILTKLVFNDYPINTIVVMMQKEVANKLLNPSLKDYSPLHVLLEYKYNLKLITHVSKNDYLPRPEIDSMVLKIDKKQPIYQITDEQKFIQIVKSLFKNRRKTIVNNLLEYVNSKDEAIELLKSINIDVDCRIEQLNLEKIIKIAKKLGV